MPKVVRFHSLGGPEVLKIEDAPLQQPGPDEVRLKVSACGLNRAEALFFRGRYMEQPKLPARIGYEAAGVVDAIGANVDKSWLGKKVAVIPGFSMNHYAVIGEQAIVPVRVLGEYPDKLSFEQAAAIWMQYLTAYGGLLHIANVGSGDFVVIPAASSSVGLAAIQIVKMQGGKSIALTRHSAKKDKLISLGADYVIATEEEDLVARIKDLTSSKGARVTFDPVAGPMLDKLAAASALGGIIIEYGGLSMQPTPFPLVTALSKLLTIRGYTLYELHQNPALLQAACRYVYHHLEQGDFVPEIAKTFPLEQIADAFRYLESNAQIGKVIVTV